jgi:elongation factor 2
MMQKLWGDNYFDNETKKWKTEPISESGKPLKRGFVHFIMDPIIELFQIILSNDK